VQRPSKLTAHALLCIPLFAVKPATQTCLACHKFTALGKQGCVQLSTLCLRNHVIACVFCCFCKQLGDFFIACFRNDSCGHHTQHEDRSCLLLLYVLPLPSVRRICHHPSQYAWLVVRSCTFTCTVTFSCSCTALLQVSS